MHAVDLALCLLADHELATSTLAVRVAAPVRASPYGAIAAVLATVDGALHGSPPARPTASWRSARPTAAVVVARSAMAPTGPWFGHPIYRGLDPGSLRCSPPYGTWIPPANASPCRRRHRHCWPSHAPATQHRPGSRRAHLGLTSIPTLPIFAVARIAGWAAHYAEELDERPVRYRGLARTP
ncbi:MAG: hypothetical protein IPF88_17955 [Candidatus Microthrix sp.]|nr:hypothetical protein [Candidatus Microthrix sp.]